LTPYKHVDIKVNVAYQNLGIIKDNFTHLTPDCFILLYKCLVRSHIEYANSVWNTQYIENNKKLQKIQMRATKLIHELKDYHTDSASSSSLPFNSCRSTGRRRRYSATPPDLVPCSLLRSSSVSCFSAPSQLSSSMCSLVFLCLDNLEGSISELFSLYCCQLSSLCAQSRSTSYE